MQYPELPFFAFLGAVLVLIPLPWHWRARNIAITAITVWLFVTDITYGVNAIVWAGNVGNPSPIWCDISTKIQIGASYALPLAMLCVCKHLELVSSTRQSSFNAEDKKRRIVFESIMCFGVPIIFMALHYIVQGHRFDIIENTGCQAAVYISIPAILIINFPQLLFSIIAAIYAALALHHFIRRRLSFAAHLKNSNSALNTNRYLRLVAMSLTQIIWGTALTSYNLWYSVSLGIRPWTSWADVHFDFSRIDLYPTIFLPTRFVRSILFFWWAIPASSFIFFIFFGFGDEAMKEYKRIWMLFRKHILKRSEESKKGSKLPTSISIPVFRNAPRPLNLVLGLKSKSLEKTLPLNPYSACSSTHQSSFTVSPPTPSKSEEASADHECDAEKTFPLPPYSASSSTHQSSITISPPTPSKSEEAVADRERDAETSETDCETIDGTDRFTMSTFSYYEQPYTGGLRDVAIVHPIPVTPRIIVSEAFSPSRVPSPTPSVPESIVHSDEGIDLPEHGDVTHAQPSSLAPGYHRPFSPPMEYPVTSPYPGVSLPTPEHGGVWITVHRQTSVDNINTV